MNISIIKKWYQTKIMCRLTTFKKVLATTPKILKNMINLEANLAIVNKTEYANKKRNIINSL